MKTVQYRAFRDEAVTRLEAAGTARRGAIDRVEAHLRRGVSVLLAGHSGVGKSYVAAEVVSRLDPRPGDQPGDSVIRCSRSRDLLRLRELRENPGNGRGVITIEDAHLLGVDDMHELVEIVSDAGRLCLITIDAQPVDLASPESLVRLQLVTSLWAEFGLERVDLPGIGFAEASTLIDNVCGDEGVDVVTRARIAHAAAGNPQLVIELTREAMHRPDGIGVDNASLVLGPITLSPRILDLAHRRIHKLSDVDAYALITLAKIGTVPYVRATRLVGQAPLRSLLRRGLVVHEPGSLELVSANALYANAAQASRDVENPLEAEHTIEKLLLAEQRNGEPLTAVECVIVAAYWANNPSVDPLVTTELTAAATIFARAARHAGMWGLPSSGELFARRSLAITPSVAATEQLSRALAGQGLHVEAVELLEGDSLAHSDRHDDADLLSWWFMLLARLGFDAARMETLHTRVAEWGTVDDLLVEFDEIIGLRAMLFESEFDRGVDDLAAFAADPTKCIMLRLRALSGTIPAYSFLGRSDDLRPAFTLGRELIGEVVMGGSTRQLGDVVTAAALFLSAVGLARAVTGVDRDGLNRDLDVYALRAVLTGDDLELALVNLVSGATSITSQNPARAEIELANAEVGIAQKVATTVEVVARLLHGDALCALQRTEEARDLLDTFDDADIRMTPWTEFYARYLEISLIADPNDRTPTRDALLDLAHFKNGRSRPITLIALFGAFLAGASASDVVARLDEIDPPGNSPAAEATEEQLRAEVARDAFRLDAVGDRLEMMGMNAQAVVSFHSAGTTHLLQGRSAEAAASFRRRDAQNSAPAAPSTPAPSQVAVDNNAPKLTRRELEVAQLAGRGMSNSEIAGSLFLSVRTVESHVLQARVKLGAARRSELGLYLTEFEPQVS